MSLSNDNVVTRTPQKVAAQAPPASSWLSSINPFTAQSNQPSLPPAVPPPLPSVAPAVPDQASGWFDFSFKKILVIVTILLFMGFNVLKMSGEGLDVVGGVGKTLFGSIGMGVGDLLKKTTDNAATGSKEAVDAARDVTIDAIDEVEDVLGGKDTEDEARRRQDNENLADAVDKPRKKKRDDDVVPDDSGSTVQQSKGAGKAGWCFVGEDRGFRSCVRVGVNDECTSGEVFSSKAICVEPTLRE